MNEPKNYYDNNESGYNQQQLAGSLTHYTCDVNKAAKVFAQSGFRIAPRTITSYCSSNLLDCEKFINGKVTKWKITRKSIDERIETLKREGYPQAGTSEQKLANKPASNNEQQPAGISNPFNQIMNILKEELKEKNKQISEYQSIIHTQNKQFENLNQTIQLSNQTIQQLNNVLALPQMKDIASTMRKREGSDYTYDVPVRQVGDHEENVSDN